MSICTKCGTSLKNPIIFNGKVYGSECVQSVSGLKSYEIRSANGNLDEYLDNQSKLVAKLKEQNEVINERIAHFTKINGWLISFLEQFANPNKSNYNGFAHSMITELTKKELKDLSEKQFAALENMWSYGLTGLNEGLARIEFVIASGIEDMSKEETKTEAKLFVLSYATQTELKEIAKENKVKGYSKMKREQLEEALTEYINF